MTSHQDASKPATEEQPRGRGGLERVLRGLVMGRRAGAGLFVLGVLYTIYFARSLLLPILLALLLAAFLEPFVRRLARFKIPNSAGAAIVLLVFVGMLGMAIYQLSGPAGDWMARGPGLLKKAEYKVWGLKQSIKKAEEKTQQLEEMATLGESKEKVTVKGPSLAERILTQTWTILATAAIVLVLIYFLLAQGRQTLARLADGLQGEEHGKRLTSLLVRVQLDIASYLGTITIIYLVVGAVTAIAMALLGMPSPVLWGVAASVLHFIPFLGPAITFFIISVVSLMTFDTWLRILLPPLVYFCLAGLEGYFVTPMILGRRLTLNPIMVFVAILFWGWMWGIVGVFLAVPVLAALKIICDDIEWLKPVGLVLGSTKETLSRKKGNNGETEMG